MSKYNNKPIQIDGIWFDSTKEGKYYLYLKQLQLEGKISNLRMQVPFVLLPPVYREIEKTKQLKTKVKTWTERVCIQRDMKYFADFVYTDNNTEEEVVVDVKSSITRKKDAYRLKKKMMLALKGIEIKEV